MLFIKWHKVHTKNYAKIQVNTVYLHVSILYLLCMGIGKPCNYNMHFDYFKQGVTPNSHKVKVEDTSTSSGYPNAICVIPLLAVTTNL